MMDYHHYSDFTCVHPNLTIWRHSLQEAVLEYVRLDVLGRAGRQSRVLALLPLLPWDGFHPPSVL